MQRATVRRGYIKVKTAIQGGEDFGRREPIVGLSNAKARDPHGIDRHTPDHILSPAHATGSTVASMART
jgi:hypothetical protein